MCMHNSELRELRSEKIAASCVLFGELARSNLVDHTYSVVESVTHFREWEDVRMKDGTD